jgi:6-phosphogluconolactonase
MKALPVIALTAVQAVAAPAVHAQAVNPYSNDTAAIEQGRGLYNGACTGCHGANGAAGEIGPGLGVPGRSYARNTDEQIFDAIKHGIPATVMPAQQNQLNDDQIWKITAYVKGLRGTAIDAPSPGDAVHGEAVFWGKGDCGSCHMVRGRGSIIGPDLSNLAGLRKTNSIIAALTREQHRVYGPGGAQPHDLVPLQTYPVVQVKTSSGKTVRGVLRNEDSFSMQIMGLDQQLYLLDRAKLKKILYEPKSLMPTDYDQRLSQLEFDDLLAYLTRLGSTPAIEKAQMPAMPPAVKAAQFIMYVGSYTAGTSKGIYAWRFESDDGSLSPLGLMAETAQPAHLWIAPNGKTLYAVNWETSGGVSSFHIDPQSGALTFLNKTSSHGAQPNQVVVDPSGRVAVTVNYTSGSLAAYPLAADGRLGEAFYVDQHTGKPLSREQPGPRQHGIQFSKDDKYLFIADLGLDRVYSYRFDAAAPSITPCDPPYANTHAGAGPRRIQMSPDGRFLYVDHETDSEVSVFAIDGGHLKEIQVIGTVPRAAKSGNTTAEIMIADDGRHLYVGNRGDDSIAIFAVDLKAGTLSHRENVPSGGRTPRNIRFDPTGGWFFAANENGGNVTEFKVDRASGHLLPTGVTGAIDTPGGIYFLAVN